MGTLSEEAAEELRRLISGVGDATAGMNDLQKATYFAAKAAKAAAEANAEFVKSLGGSLSKTASALTSSTPGLAKYSGAVDSAADAASNLAERIPILGAAIAGAIQVFAKLTGMALKQNDALSKTFDSLSQFGAIDAGGFKSVLEDLQKVGGNSENVQYFLDGMKAAGPSLALLGGTAAEGRKKLAEIFGPTLGNTEERIRRFGMTTEEMFKYTGSFIKQQTVSGGTLGKTTAQLNTESVRYLDLLNDISRLTGLNRDELDAARKAQEADVRLQYHLMELRESGAAGEAEAERIQNSLAYVSKTYGKGIGEGMTDMILNNGAITSDKAAAVAQVMGNKGFASINKIIKGNGDLATDLGNFTTEMSPTIRKNFKQFGTTLKLGGEAGLVEMGITREAMSGMLLGVSIDTVKANNEKLELEKEATNARRDAEVKAAQLERKIKKIQEDLIYQFGDKLVPVISFVTKVMYALTKVMAGVIDWMSKWVPGMKETHLSDMFRDLSDNAEDLKKVETEKLAVEKNIVNNEKKKALLEQVVKKGDDVQGSAVEKKKAQEDALLAIHQANSKLLDDNIIAAADEKDAVKKKLLLVTQQELLQNRQNSYELLIALRTNKLKDFQEKSAKTEEADKKLLLEREKKLLDLKEENTKLGGTEVAKSTEKGKQVVGSDDARKKAEEYYGNKISDAEFSTLLKATHAEAGAGKGASQEEQAMIMASIINRARTHPKGITGALYAKNQFQSVTGTAADNHQPSKNFLDGPAAQRLKDIEGSTNYLAGIPHWQKNFTSADPKAYGPGTNIKYMNDMIAKGGKIIGGSVFETSGPKKDTKTDTKTANASALPKADTGGVFSGPSGGYPVMLHGPGKEFVFKEHQLKTMVESVQKSTLESQLGSLTNPQSTSGVSSNEDIKSIVAMLGDKFDDLLNEMRNGNNIQDKVLSALA